MEQCPLDPYIIVPDRSVFIDQQAIKLQENPDMVPVGELPRHMLASADRYLANRAVPGSRVTLLAVYSIFQTRSTVSSSWLCTVSFGSYCLMIDACECACRSVVVFARRWH